MPPCGHVSRAPCSDAPCPMPHAPGHMSHAPSWDMRNASCMPHAHTVPMPCASCKSRASCFVYHMAAQGTDARLQPCASCPLAPCPMPHALMSDAPCAASIHAPMHHGHAPHAPCPPNIRPCIMSGALHQNREISLERLWGLRVVAVISEFRSPPAPHSISSQSNLVLPVE